MNESLLIAGAGGQGIIMIGRILASAAMRITPYVTFFPSYGAEVRGGTANCQVVLSSEEIPSPSPSLLHSLLVMNQPSFLLYRKRLTRTGLLIVNATLCTVPPNVRNAVKIPATEMAERLGDIRAANMIMLGAYVSRKQLVPAAEVETEIRSVFAKRSNSILELNLQAFRAGLRI